MFKNLGRCFIFTIIFSVITIMTTFASPGSFPFIVEFDLEEVDRLCYAGHEGAAVRYRDGIAVTPYSSFCLSREDVILDGIQASDVYAEVAILYESDDHSVSHREVIKTFEVGTLEEDVFYELLSGNNIENLKESGKLYSDSLSGMTISFTIENDNGSTVADYPTKTLYLYVCSDEDYYFFYDNAGMN